MELPLTANKGARASDGSLASIGVGPPVPLLFNDLNVKVDLTVRWITANQLELNGLTLAGNLAQRECT